MLIAFRKGWSDGRFERKVDVIYDLRAAAERKGRAERDVDADPSRENRDALLEAQLELEQKTVAALQICQQCEHERPKERAAVTLLHGAADTQNR